MVDVLVFSKDRAAQLDLLLRSIDRHAPDLYSSITVLFAYSSLDFLDGYAACAKEHVGKRFTYQQVFEQKVREWLATAEDLVSFLVDDDVFYRDLVADVSAASRAISLRGGDYDYPFSVDGNIYLRADVVEHLSRFSFNDPTHLEARAHEQRHLLPFQSVTPVEPPCLVGIPANRVSVSSGMPHMGVSTRNLNDAFLRGERIECVFDMETYPAHWPVEYRMVVPA